MRKKKLLTIMLLTLVFVFTLSGCNGAAVVPTDVTPTTTTTDTGSNTTTGTGQTATTTPAEITVNFSNKDLDDSESSDTMSYITLTDGSIVFMGSGAEVDGNVITVTEGGMYQVTGSLSDGQIIVDCGDDDVKLVLSDAEISCSDSAPIYVVQADKVIITLAAGTGNTVTDGEDYVFADGGDEPKAAIYSKDDLTINGSGTLTVNANYNNGIQSQDDLRITGGNIIVTAANDGIQGRDSIAIKAGNITVNAAGDGLQTTNEDDADEGCVYIAGGILNITAGEDGIQAASDMYIEGGEINIVSGGGSGNSSNAIGSDGNTWGNWRPDDNPGTSTTDDASAKGLKAAVSLVIKSGTFNIDSSDDAIHSNDNVTINGGVFLLASGDDGIHADTSLTINGGEITISTCYEGIESAVINVNGGIIQLDSSDDGINVSGGADESAMGGRPGQNNFNTSGNDYLALNGGYIYIDAGGDGIDVNGYVTMTGGEIIVNGPTNNGNGALDYLGSFNISGGFLVAAGSSGMAQAPSNDSSQYSVLINLTSTCSAGEIIHIETADGDNVLTFAPTKTYQSLVLCSAELENGATYVVYSGGSATGTISDGLYTDTSYQSGTETASFTITGIVTSVGSGGGMDGGQMGDGTRPNRRF